VVDSNLIIDWTRPENGGSPIVGYIVKLRDNDGDYHLETKYCDGSSLGARVWTSCTIPLTLLMDAPFNLLLGDRIFAKIQAINLYGVSLESVPGDGTAMVQ